MEYTYVLTEKTIPDLMAFHEALAAVVPSFLGITVDSRGFVVILSENPSELVIQDIESVQPPSVNANKQTQLVVSNAISFGNKLVVEFASENILMGITQDGMTKIVRQNMTEVISALQTGSLYDAINEARNIPIERKDAKYITNERLLQFINKIESYLNKPLSQSL